MSFLLPFVLRPTDTLAATSTEPSTTWERWGEVKARKDQCTGPASEVVVRVACQTNTTFSNAKPLSENDDLPDGMRSCQSDTYRCSDQTNYVSTHPPPILQAILTYGFQTVCTRNGWVFAGVCQNAICVDINGSPCCQLSTDTDQSFLVGPGDSQNYNPTIPARDVTTECVGSAAELASRPACQATTTQSEEFHALSLPYLGAPCTYGTYMCASGILPGYDGFIVS